MRDGGFNRWSMSITTNYIFRGSSPLRDWLCVCQMVVDYRKRINLTATGDRVPFIGEYISTTRWVRRTHLYKPFLKKSTHRNLYSPSVPNVFFGVIHFGTLSWKRSGALKCNWWEKHAVWIFETNRFWNGDKPGLVCFLSWVMLYYAEELDEIPVFDIPNMAY